jgi:preprotein translocase subunit SecA
VLVGTVNVDVSETLSRTFQRAGLKHNVLNAKYHQREAEIVAEAGQPGAITIATNMAGRGTDIKLGAGVTKDSPSQVKDPEGKPVDVVECGGLHIIGSERHESRRIDRQLRGRAGRQGDPGASQFFLSLEDDLMRLFGSERIASLMDRLGAQEGEHLTHPLITRSIGQAQKRVELQNFQTRKRLLDYDDVMNQQREVIYSLRAFALEGGEELKGEARKMVEQALARRIEQGVANFDSPEQWDFGVLRQDLLMHYLITVPQFAESEADPPRLLPEAQQAGQAAGAEAFENKLKTLGAQAADPVLSFVMLKVLDDKWKDHLYDLDQLRAAINYRAWGQKDPLIEYKQEAYSMFVDLMADIYHTFAEQFLRAQFVFEPAPPPSPLRNATPVKPAYDAQGMLRRDGDDGVTMDVGPGEAPAREQVARRETPNIAGVKPVAAVGSAGKAPVDWSAVGRNDPCPCGSGKKFKKCHGAQ